ncbi:MAG: pilus assembly protein PilY, partial [Neisseriaceae bacterium]|nr:pilus assembly protein PilY [Neisseriaceae bacterium]
MKRQEKGRTRIKPISRMLWFAFPALALPFFAFAEINTPFHHRALSGVTEDMGSNVTLALSVEFPTAGAAYSASNNQPVVGADVMKTKYLGYFDNEKCYRYVADSSDPTGAQAFSNSGYVQNSGIDNAYWYRPVNKWNSGVNFKYITNAKEYFEPVRKAENSGDFIGVCNGADEFSGNFMNWLSMSAIDIFRQALTGGNRAIGVNTNQDNYTSADTENFTTIRRAKIQNGQNDRYSMNKSVILTTDQIKMFLPHSYAINAGTVLKQGSQIKNSSLFLYGGYGGTLSVNSTELFFRNHDFGLDIRRLVNAGNVNFYAPISGRIMPYQVNVMVCKEGLLESNCAKQANGKYKPEGLIQKNARKMRFSTLGYANIAGNGVNGGLLRSEMAYVLDPRTDSSQVAPKFLPEIDPTTGQFDVNPDASLGEKNSGTINYLNKFGDLGGYKTNDPVAELYYTALRYLRNKDFPSQYVPFTRNDGTGGNIPGSLTDTEKDNFPAIVNWKNPLVVYPDGATSVAIDKDSANVCRNNYLILIGDTNTHDDKDLPNGWGSKNVPDEQIDTQALLQEIFNQEGFSGNLNQNFGSQNSPAGFPALAYWARNNPLQPGFNKRLKTFAIDVVESDNYKTGRNTYYLAAKYGGFDEEGVSGSNKNNVPDVLAEWIQPNADDKIGAFTDAGKETPKTFAVANSPEAMVKALNSAFAGTVTGEKPSSTGTASTSNGKEIKKGDSIILLQSAYRDTSSTDENGNPLRIYAGDVLAFKTTFTDTDEGVKVDRIRIWSADEKLNAAANHNSKTGGEGWKNRKVYTRTSPDGDVIEFNTANASILSSSLGVSDTYAQSLIAYTLGDPSNEGSDKAFRLRKDLLMGTVIYSTVIPVDKVDVDKTTVNTPKGSCTYPASANATTRDVRYVVAANDGMTYILGENGEELASYLPSKALPKLADY